MKTIINIVLAAVLALFITGCVGTPVLSVDKSQYLEQRTPLTKVEQAIKQGAMKKGWNARKVKSGLMEARILARGKYLVVVNINYSKTGYKITYKDSTNLKYDSETNTIHKSYNKWVNALSTSIDYSLLHAGSRATTSSRSHVSAKPSNYKQSSKSIDLQGKTVYISHLAAYSNERPIAQNIKTECTIDAQIMTFIKQFAASSGVNVVMKDKISPNDLELKITIIDAISAGGAFRGHRKGILFSGELVKGKTKYYSFTATRVSGGGYFGAYKSSCSVLGRVTKAVGRDISVWLAGPSDGAQLGDGYMR